MGDRVCAPAPDSVRGTLESRAIFSDTMQREYLSSALTVPMKVATALMLAFAVPVTFVAFSEGKPEILIVLTTFCIFAAYSWIQSVVYIENDELVVKRHGRSVRLRPEDIYEVDYLWPTRLLKVSFNRTTSLGKWIVLGARTQSVFKAEGPIGDDGPVFKRLGEFCGWRND